jgi:hypothetical protein
MMTSASLSTAPTGQQLRAAVELPSDVDGLRLVMTSTVGS